MTDTKNPLGVEIHAGEEKLVLDHNYDGIRELDHVLPRWWLWGFFATIAFSVGYCGFYWLGPGLNQQQELTLALSEIEARKPAPNPELSGKAELLAASKDPAKLKHGSEVFAGKCVACHGEKAQGVIGPNLTDDHWLQGDGTLVAIAAVVTNGVPEKGMPPWVSVLTPDELRDVVAYVHSVHGTNPPEAKPPQGEKHEFQD